MAQLMQAHDPAELIGRPSDFMLPPDLTEEVRGRIDRLYAGQVVPRMELTYLRLDGTSVIVEVASAPLLLQGRQAAQVTVRDISARRRTENPLEGQRRVLEMIAEGRPLRQTLEAIAHLIEAEADGMLVSIMLLDADGKHLRHGASPSLPEAFCEAIDGKPIGPRAGSCGTSAFRGEPVVTEDILTDPLWDDYRALATSHGLRASWSTPIFDAQRRLVGTFAMYFRSPGPPDMAHVRLVEVATSTAGIAIGRHREVEALRLSETSLAAAQKRAKLGNWELDLHTLTGRWSAQMFELFGRDPQLGVPNFVEFAALVHPLDRALLERANESAAAGTEPVAIDFRTDPAQGEVRHFSALVEAVRDADGRSTMLVGNVHDITERKLSEAHIAYLASHDGLTGLANRNLLQDRIIQAASHVRRIGRTTAVVLLNIDRFQVVNSGYGHEFGDAMLRAVGVGRGSGLALPHLR
jgi:PAS domain S-box-containing protein